MQKDIFLFFITMFSRLHPKPFTLGLRNPLKTCEDCTKLFLSSPQLEGRRVRMDKGKETDDRKAGHMSSLDEKRLTQS